MFTTSTSNLFRRVKFRCIYQMAKQNLTNKKRKANGNNEISSYFKKLKNDDETLTENDDATESLTVKAEFKENIADKEDGAYRTASVDKVEKSSYEEENLKIISWNVNGIRAWLEHDGLEFVKAEDPDIFCTQGDKNGYSGVGVMTKTKPIKVTYGINVPNSQRGLTRLAYRMEWEKAFLKFLKSLDEKKPVVWCGDINVAHQPIDLKNPGTNTKTAGFTKEERECFTNLLKEGFVDSFRHLYPEKTGAYTFWSYFHGARESNAGWRLDYFVLSDRLKNQLSDSSIRSDIRGSDHCPIVLQIKI